MKPTAYNTALYLRLSRDDELQGESNSISTQRMMLRKYAEQNSFTVVNEYVDDGYSGTNFDRPDFKRMMDDIEAGKINCVITKDLSRLGRNYLQTGYYMEVVFPEHNVRYIAIDNNVDSENQQDNEFTPFLNIINEWYARDISRKVKRALRTRNEAGAHYSTYAPLGYIKDPDKKGHLLIDEETRWIVEKIYDLALQGAGAAKITKILTAEKVSTAGWLNYKKHGSFANIYAGAPPEKAYAWTIAQVKSILKDETYIGNSVHNKQSNISFKNKRKVRKPQDEWWRVENTHEPIISKEDFESVQEMITSRRRQQKDGTTQIFAGLVKCPDCGWSMRFGTNRQNKTPYSHYTCSQYGQGLGQCSPHYTRYDVLYACVLSRVQYYCKEVQKDESRILKQILKSSDSERNSSKKKAASELKKAQKRQAEIDNLFAKLYEDRIADKITERNFSMLSDKYQTEQATLSQNIDLLHQQLAQDTQKTADAEKWIALIKQYVPPTELTSELLNALIEKIIVHEAVKDENKNRVQEVEIYYRFIGKID
ncbi:MAG: recombinase family protein [Clostridium sp.]|nr:recombinase family protein [Clostridium sp.]